MKTITLKKVGYYITGTVNLTLWGGGNGCIGMKPFKLKVLNKKQISNNLNDNGFGCQSIDGAVCSIFTLYENDYKEYLKDIEVGKVNQFTYECFYNDI